jgi:putative heme transporter
MLQGKGLGLHAAVVILAVTGGSSLFGIAGAFFAVPVVAVGAEFLRYLSEQVDRAVGAVDAGIDVDGAPPAAEPPAGRPEPAAETARET